MNNITEKQRFRVEMREYTEEERAKMKEEIIAKAMAWEPPMHYTVDVILNPGDPGYEDAPFESSFVWLNIAADKDDGCPSHVLDAAAKLGENPCFRFIGSGSSKPHLAPFGILATPNITQDEAK